MNKRLKSKIVFVVFAFIFSIASIANATYVKMVEPYNMTLYNNNSIFLGKVGPGQVFYVSILGNTTNLKGEQVSGAWNRLNVTAPVGWGVENSSLYRTTLSAKVTVPGNVKYGLYNLTFEAINIGNYSKAGTLVFHATVNVTPDVFRLYVYPSAISAGPGQPATIYVVINNTGVSDTPFVINATGIPAWNYTETVIALHHTTRTFEYPVYENEPGVYNININVTSFNSKLIHESAMVNLNVQSSIINDYEALGEGALTFPIIYAPAYAFMNLIGKIFS
ncbi:MAG: hypothetical protein ACP5RI_03575 [Candidatus Micrarchaeia archaeon]